MENLIEEADIVEEKKEGVNKTKESVCIEFQPEVIKIPEETEKSEKRAHEIVKVEDHEENISPF